MSCDEDQSFLTGKDIKQDLGSPTTRVYQPFFYILLGSLLTLIPATIIIAPVISKSIIISPTHLSKTSQAALAHTTDLKYFPQEKILIATSAKAGSTSIWAWLYTGLTGRPKFNCTTYVQNVQSPCWENRVKLFSQLSESTRQHALTSPSVLRVAIHRDPYDRLISSFKSKFACASEKYHTDYNDRQRMVPQLRKHANLNAENVPCLNISSFAHTLDAVRIRAGNGQFDIWSLNAHVRPQRLFLDIISYSLVLDIRDLSKSDVVRPIVERLGFGRLVDKGVPVLHASTGEEVWIPAHAARMIANFAKIEDRGGGESASKD